jgi:hypothetical protein
MKITLSVKNLLIVRIMIGKRFLIISLLLAMSQLLYSKKLNIKGVEFEIIFGDPYAKNHKYEYEALEGDDNDYHLAVVVLKHELFKYPQPILKYLIHKRFYIVKSISGRESDIHKEIEGVCYFGFIVLKYEVLRSYYKRNVIHHEIFHSILGSSNDYYIGKTIRDINKCISEPKNEIPCLTYSSDYITTYHPNTNEDLCEMFSFLMYSYRCRYNCPLIEWVNREENKGRKLRIKVMELIKFTKTISSGIMNEQFYYDLMLKDQKYKLYLD